MSYWEYRQALSDSWFYGGFITVSLLLLIVGGVIFDMREMRRSN